jgi:3-deoxy-D-manno-octulosonic-acid transferase
MKLLYTISIHLYNFAIRCASLFNAKARLWINGRKNIFKKLNADFANRSNNEPLIWVHCASLGEFEQGRPLIEKIKKEKAGVKILLTFFSPSGYEIRKNYGAADYVYYLPSDTPANTREFISLVKPDAALFVKYEFWFNYLSELKRQEIPTYLVCGIFRAEQHFFKNYGAWFRMQLSAFTHFYLQDTASKELLNSIGYTNTTVAGDTRFDRVMEISNTTREINFIKKFIGNEKAIVAGSTWNEDIQVLSGFRFREAGFKLIIAPHEVAETSIQSTIQQFNNLQTIRYSQANEQTMATADILIIDNIGMLSSLYKYGSIAFIGGGFGKGIHNILEAAAFGLPVVFGPNYHKFNEAKELILKGGAFSVTSSDGLKNKIDLLNQPDVLKMAAFAAKNYVSSNAGATEKIISSIKITSANSH